MSRKVFNGAGTSTVQHVRIWMESVSALSQFSLLTISQTLFDNFCCCSKITVLNGVSDYATGLFLQKHDF